MLPPTVLRVFCLLSVGYFIGALAARKNHRTTTPASEDDYYYYEDDEPPATDESSAASAPARDSSDYELADLVKAWKDYVKDKAKKNAAPPPPPPEPEYECPPRDDSYRTPDEEQCDKYIECNIKGEEKVHLCPDGFVFDIKLENCDYPSKVNCSGRPILQPPQPGKNCTRANGFFAFPANESCQKFWDCRGGKANLQTCPAGIIFDPFIDACITPDQSNRPGCGAGKFLGFECPQYGPDDELRFGNHDNLPSPHNCQEYFSCFKPGVPRRGECQKNKVFNNATGQCADPKTVPGCETYFIDKAKLEDKDKDKDSDDYSDYS